MNIIAIIILSLLLPIYSYSQVKVNSDYIIIHPSFTVGQERVASEIITESIETKDSIRETTSQVIQRIKITGKNSSGYHINFKFTSNELKSLDSHLNKYYHTSNSINLKQISDITLKMDKWGYFDSIKHTYLSKENLKVYEANFMKYVEWADVKHSPDSLMYSYNYQNLVGTHIKNRKYNRQDITELIFNIVIFPGSSFDRIIPIGKEITDSIRTNLSFIDGDLIVLNNINHRFTSNTLKLISRNRFLIPEEKYPINYLGQELHHLEWEENQSYIIDKESGWPISKLVEIRKVFNDRIIKITIETKFENP